METVHQVRVRGPLERHAAGGRAAFAALGYAPGTIENHVRVLAHLSQWMAVEGIVPSALSQAEVERFFAVLRTQWRRPPTGRTLAPLLGWLRDQQVVPPASRVTCATPIDVLVGRYGTWLVPERGVSPATLRGYTATARRFLAGCPTAVADLRGADVTAFLLVECARLAVDSAKGVVTALRSRLRFLSLMELTPLPLASAVPPVAGWRETRLPATLTPADVQTLLASCDRAHPTGQRDFAILTLLARLGPRAAEVAGLPLESVDWRAGELMVRGKGRRVDRLPPAGRGG